MPEEKEEMTAIVPKEKVIEPNEEDELIAITSEAAEDGKPETIVSDEEAAVMDDHGDEEGEKPEVIAPKAEDEGGEITAIVPEDEKEEAAIIDADRDKDTSEADEASTPCPVIEPALSPLSITIPAAFEPECDVTLLSPIDGGIDFEAELHDWLSTLPSTYTVYDESGDEGADHDNEDTKEAKKDEDKEEDVGQVTNEPQLSA